MVIRDRKTKLKKERLVKVAKRSKAILKIKIQKQKTYHKETT